MSAPNPNIPAPAHLVGYGVVVNGRSSAVYPTQSEAEYRAGFAADLVKPLYTLPDYLRLPPVTWGMRLRWFLAGAIADAFLGTLLHIAAAAL